MFEKFRSFSGLKVNLEKTSATYIGSWKGRKGSGFSLKWLESYVSMLGATITGNKLDNYKYNYKPCILKVQNLLKSWKNLNLSLKGKVTIVNTLALPRLYYIMNALVSQTIYTLKFKKNSFRFYMEW